MSTDRKGSPSRPRPTRRTFTIREQLQAKLGRDEAALIYDRLRSTATGQARKRRRRKAAVS